MKPNKFDIWSLIIDKYEIRNVNTYGICLNLNWITTCLQTRITIVGLVKRYKQLVIIFLQAQIIY